MTDATLTILLNMPEMVVLGTQVPVTPQLTPHQRLRLAAIENGLRNLQLSAIAKQSVRGLRIWQEEVAWFHIDDPASPFSFVNCCAAVGLDPDWLRRGLAKSLIDE